jgi:hypothetical protein
VLAVARDGARIADTGLSVRRGRIRRRRITREAGEEKLAERSKGARACVELLVVHELVFTADWEERLKGRAYVW